MKKYRKTFSRKNMPKNVSIYVQGGNVQVLPNATQAMQYIFCSEASDARQCCIAEIRCGSAKSDEQEDAGSADDESEAVRLARGVLCVYYPKKEDLEAIIGRIADCINAADLANLVVYDMLINTILNNERIVSKGFIEALRPFLTFKTGATVGNIRAQINNAMRRR